MLICELEVKNKCFGAPNKINPNDKRENKKAIMHEWKCSGFFNQKLFACILCSKWMNKTEYHLWRGYTRSQN